MFDLDFLVAWFTSDRNLLGWNRVNCNVSRVLDESRFPRDLGTVGMDLSAFQSSISANPSAKCRISVKSSFSNPASYACARVVKGIHTQHRSLWSGEVSGIVIQITLRGQNLNNESPEIQRFRLRGNLNIGLVVVVSVPRDG